MGTHLHHVGEAGPADVVAPAFFFIVEDDRQDEDRDAEEEDHSDLDEPEIGPSQDHQKESGDIADGLLHDGFIPRMGDRLGSEMVDDELSDGTTPGLNAQ